MSEQNGGRGKQFDQFCDETSFHGPAEYKRSKWKGMKPFWIWIMFGFAIVCGIQIYGLLSGYFANPITTTSIPRPVSNQTIPPLLVCLGNAISKPKADNLPPQLVNQALAYRLSHATSMLYDLPELLWMRRAPKIDINALKDNKFNEYMQYLEFQRCVDKVVLDMMISLPMPDNYDPKTKTPNLESLNPEPVADIYMNGVIECGIVLFNTSGITNQTKLNLVPRTAILFVYAYSLLPPEESEDGACFADEFKCKDKSCIRKEWKCDQVYDCADKSDEGKRARCKEICKPGDIPCGLDGDQVCFTEAQRCNGVPDCGDRAFTDETNCDDLCKQNGNHECIKSKNNATQCVSGEHAVCDGICDCVLEDDLDNCSDEVKDTCELFNKTVVQVYGDSSYGSGYEYFYYSEEECTFECSANSGENCIIESWVCDGYDDCADGKDEQDCSTTSGPETSATLDTETDSTSMPPSTQPSSTDSSTPESTSDTDTTLPDTTDSTTTAPFVRRRRRRRKRNDPSQAFDYQGYNDNPNNFDYLYNGNVTSLNLHSLPNSREELENTLRMIAGASWKRIMGGEFRDRNGRLNVTALTEKISFKVEEVFRECRAFGLSFNCTKYIVPRYDAKYGQCYLVNYAPLEQTEAGLGLALLIRTNALSGFKPNGGSGYYPSLYDGIVLRFLQDDYSAASSDYHVPASSIAFMQPERTDYDRRVSESYGKCRKKMDSQIMKMDHYTNDACQLECGYRSVRDNCGCLPPIHQSQLNDFDTPTCQTYDEQKCWKKAGFNKTTECTDQCIPACEQTVYKATLTTQKLGSYQIMDAVNSIPHLMLSSLSSDNLGLEIDDVPVNDGGIIDIEKIIRSQDFLAIAQGDLIIDKAPDFVEQPDESEFSGDNALESVETTPVPADPFAVKDDSDAEAANERESSKAYQDLISKFSSEYQFTKKPSKIAETSFGSSKICSFTTVEPELNKAQEENTGCDAASKAYTDTWQSEHVLVLVAFEDFLVNTIQQKMALGWEDFLGQIGGALGLWLGGSLMSCVHVLVFFCQFMFPALDDDDENEEAPRPATGPKMRSAVHQVQGVFDGVASTPPVPK